MSNVKALYASLSDDEKRQAMALKKGGMSPGNAVARVRSSKIGAAAVEAQPDLDAAESDPSAFENVAAFAQGAAHNAALGLDDEAAGVLHAAAPWNAIPAANDEGFSAIPRLYKEGRDDQRDANDAIERFAPTATHAGDAFATVAQAALPGPKAATAAKELPSLGRGILEGLKVGAVTGAASGFGRDDGNVVENTVGGGVVGGGIGAGGGLLAGLLNPVARTNTAGFTGRVVDAVKKRLKPIDLIGEIPKIGPRLKGLAEDVAAAEARQPRGAVEVLEPALSDDFVRPTTIDGEVVRPQVGGRPEQPRLTGDLADVADDIYAGGSNVVDDGLDELANLRAEDGFTAADVVPDSAPPDLFVNEPKPTPTPPEKPPFRGWDDEFDEAGLTFDPRGVRNPVDDRLRKAAAESLGPSSSKGSLQRMTEQVRETPAVPQPAQQQIDETAAYVASLTPDQRVTALTQLAAGFGDDAAKAVAKKAGVPWASVSSSRNAAQHVEDLQSLQEIP